MEKPKATKLLANYEYIISLLEDLRELKAEDGPMLREVMEDYTQEELLQLRDRAASVRKIAYRIFKSRQPKQEKKK